MSLIFWGFKLKLSRENLQKNDLINTAKKRADGKFRSFIPVVLTQHDRLNEQRAVFLR